MEYKYLVKKITNAINNVIAKGNDHTEVVVSTEPEMNKTDNPYYGRIKKITCYCGVHFGDYSAVVNARRTAEGLTADFKVEKSIYEKVNEFIVKHPEKGTHYLRLMLTQDVNVISYYTLDGRPVKPYSKTENDIKAHLRPNYYNKKQGLSEGNQVQFRTIKLENIAAIGGESLTIKIQNIENVAV